MDDLDKKISDMLNAEERAIMAPFEQKGLLWQFTSIFQGEQGWFMILVLVIGSVMGIIGLYGAVKFATATDLTSILRWGGIAWIGLFSVSLIKIWSWMRMETNRSLREIKRLELQIAMMQSQK